MKVCQGYQKKLENRLQKREENNALRSLQKAYDLVDFSSNDYLGFAKNAAVFKAVSEILSSKEILQNGATGSRLLSGNYQLYTELEEKLCRLYKTEATLVFNSGYDANIGFFSSVPQRGDIIFYDEYIHASIRDGIQMGNAKSYKFKHNNLDDLKIRCQTERGHSPNETDIYSNRICFFYGWRFT
ncbi:8-amino-7-oxononanoate synthase [hydrothermal vent metagenome]|uniref:8-amino-7-oxononanoate synthase n=1 Tax=hydrothermal vent metagenome TaxID=652676 RepID=A0A3B0T6N4_9ZZZZ